MYTCFIGMVICPNVTLKEMQQYIIAQCVPNIYILLNLKKTRAFLCIKRAIFIWNAQFLYEMRDFFKKARNFPQYFHYFPQLRNQKMRAIFGKICRDFLGSLNSLKVRHVWNLRAWYRLKKTRLQGLHFNLENHK